MENSFDAVRAMMLENVERVGFVTQIYVDLAVRIMRLFPGANEELIRTFKEYIERQVATSREFMERLLRAKNFSGGPRHSGRALSVSVDGGRRGDNSDRRMDSWPGEFTQAFFWLADVSLIVVAAIGRV